MPGRPPKPYLELAADNDSLHMTKAELRARKEAEESLLTGEGMKITEEVAANPRAAKEFARVKDLFAFIKKDDDIYGSVMNRYCLLLAECAELSIQRTTLSKALLSEEVKKELDQMQLIERVEIVERYSNMIRGIDIQLKNKRDQMLAIEKENAMTIMGALRSVPRGVSGNKTGGKWQDLKKPDPLKDTMDSLFSH
jgi:hypothetical protein